MAQQKKTSPAEDKPLTPEECEFVANIMSGMNQTDAFRALPGRDDWQDASLRVSASRMANKANVALTLDQMRAEALNAAKCDREEHLQELKRLSLRSEAAGNYGAAVQAEQLRGKVAGHYVDQHKDVTDENPLDILNRIAKLNPDLAQLMAQEQGIEYRYVHEEPEGTQ